MNPREPESAPEDQRLKLFQEANDVFEKQPGYHAAFARLMRRTDKLLAKTKLPDPPMPSDERATFALRMLDLRAEYFTALIGDTATQKAFMSAVGMLERLAWEDYTGPRVRIQPLPSHEVFARIQRRLRSWVLKSHTKLSKARNPVAAKPAEHERHAKRRAPRSLKERLNQAVASLGITHEELAHRMKIGKTTYYSVIGGGGKDTTKIIVKQFLDDLESQKP